MRVALLVISTIIGLTAPGVACESYRNVPQDQAQKLIDILTSKNAKQLERIFAFGALVCADMPALREYAMQEGLKAASDSMTRGQVLLEILMQKQFLRVDFIDSPTLPKSERDWIAMYKGLRSYRINYKDRVQGCFSLNRGDMCEQNYQIRIKGTKIEIISGQEFGQFDLQPDNTLRGFVKPNDRAAPIPSKIELF